ELPLGAKHFDVIRAEGTRADVACDGEERFRFCIVTPARTDVPEKTIDLHLARWLCTEGCRLRFCVGKKCWNAQSGSSRTNSRVPALEQVREKRQYFLGVRTFALSIVALDGDSIRLAYF